MTVVVPTDGLEVIPQSYLDLLTFRRIYGADTHDDHWLGLGSVSLRDAAYLLCGLDPIEVPKLHSEPNVPTIVVGKENNERVSLLSKRLRDRTKVPPARRSWRDWHAVARKIGADYHKGFDYFFEVEHPATGTVAVESTQTQTVQTQAATPSASTKAAGSVVNADGWTVRKPTRFTAYAVPLHRFLVSAHREGKPRPTARDVVEEWRVNRPAEIAQVMADSIDYYDSKGDTKAADLEAIRKAIGRMTSAR